MEDEGGGEGAQLHQQTHSPVPLHHPSGGPPPPLGEDLWADHAARLAGLAGVLLGWRPAEFWNATPAELASVLRVLAGAEGDPGDAALLARLKEMYPDG